MEVSQKKRLRKNSSWEATFPNEPVGEKSRSFLQRVVFIVASHILYSRGLIPAKYFKKRQIEKTKFYVVRAEATGRDIVHTLKGVMEAIEFAYLRDFIIIVADRDREDEYEALEVHRIRKGEKVDNVKYIGIMQARRQFFHLIHRISAYGSIMGPIPQNICTIFKLTYYDEKTPPDYEPQGFMADESLFHFSRKVQSLTIGRFDCEKHMVTTSIHSVFVKNAIEMKSLMHATKFNSSVSRDTTICSSPPKTLRTLSTCIDEFSQVEEDNDNEQQNDPMKSTGLAASSSFIDTKSTAEIKEIYTCDIANCIMGNLFGKRRPALPPISQQDQAILQLKNQRDKMKQYMKRNEKQMEREKELAKQLIKANKKDRALLILKRKKYQESVIERMLQQLDTIEKMVSDLEFAVIEQKVVEQLKHGNEVLKRMNQMISIDDIERIMDETKEAAEFQEEISNMLSGKLDEDDLEEVEKEFAKLLKDESELVLPEVSLESLPAKIPEKIKERRERVALEAT